MSERSDVDGVGIHSFIHSLSTTDQATDQPTTNQRPTNERPTIYLLEYDELMINDHKLHHQQHNNSTTPTRPPTTTTTMNNTMEVDNGDDRGRTDRAAGRQADRRQADRPQTKEVSDQRDCQSDTHNDH